MFQFDADANLTDEGVWMPFKESEFLIAHISNMKFQKALNRLQLPHRKALDRGTLDPAIQKDLTCKAMSEGLLLDWRKVVDKEGKETAYTPAAGLIALKKNAEFRDFVSEVSMSLANYMQDEREEVGNG